MKSAPVAIFLYKRPKHVSQLFESLLQCARLNECDVFLFCDGARKLEDEQDVQNAREVAKEFGRLVGATVVEREQNLGLARSIVDGVTGLCKQYGRAIVLEDDLILHPFFVDFMLQSLDRYAEDQRVAQVAGFTFPFKTPRKPDAFFLPLTTSWGWATWQRAWDLFSWETQSALSALDGDPRMRAEFDLQGAYPFTDMLRSVREGKIDTWDIQWYWHTFAANRLVLYPRRSLVWQNGFDEAATHTSTPTPGLQGAFTDFQRERWHSTVVFPQYTETDQILFARLKSVLRPKLAPRTPLARLKSKASHVWARLVKWGESKMNL